MMLTGISSQGHHSRDEYVTKYRLDYSVDGSVWFRYTHAFDSESEQIELEANKDSKSVTAIKFLHEIKARYLRIVAKTWHNGICLRVRVLGFNGTC